VRRADSMYREVVWMSVFCESYVLSGVGLWDGLIPSTKELYGCLFRMLCVVR